MGKPTRKEKVRALERERRRLVEQQNSIVEQLIIGAPSRASAILTFAATIPTLIASALVFANPAGPSNSTLGWLLLAIIMIAFLVLLWNSYQAATTILRTLPPRPLEVSLPQDDFASLGAELIGDDLERDVDAAMVEQEKAKLIINSKTLDELREHYQKSIKHIERSLKAAIVILVIGVIMKVGSSNDYKPEPVRSERQQDAASGRQRQLGFPNPGAANAKRSDSARPLGQSADSSGFRPNGPGSGPGTRGVAETGEKSLAEGTAAPLKPSAAASAGKGVASRKGQPGDRP